AGDQFHHEKIPTICVLEAVERRDARMIQGGERFRLALEARDAFAVGGELREDDFDRDVTAELGVVRAIDGSHSAFAQPVEDLVVTEGLADHWSAAIIGTKGPGGCQLCDLRANAGYSEAHVATTCDLRRVRSLSIWSRVVGLRPDIVLLHDTP